MAKTAKTFTVFLHNKCLHGKAQNQNEAVNKMVWEQTPKEVSVGMELLEFGLYDVISHFNIGARTVLLLLTALKITPGKYIKMGGGVLTYIAFMVPRVQRK